MCAVYSFHDREEYNGGFSIDSAGVHSADVNDAAAKERLNARRKRFGKIDVQPEGINTRVCLYVCVCMCVLMCVLTCV